MEVVLGQTSRREAEGVPQSPSSTSAVASRICRAVDLPGSDPEVDSSLLDSTTLPSSECDAARSIILVAACESAEASGWEDIDRPKTLAAAERNLQAARESFTGEVTEAAVPLPAPPLPPPIRPDSSSAWDVRSARQASSSAVRAGWGTPSLPGESREVTPPGVSREGMLFPEIPAEFEEDDVEVAGPDSTGRWDPSTVCLSECRVLTQPLPSELTPSTALPSGLSSRPSRISATAVSHPIDTVLHPEARGVTDPDTDSRNIYPSSQGISVVSAGEFRTSSMKSAAVPCLQARVTLTSRVWMAGPDKRTGDRSAMPTSLATHAGRPDLDPR